jgi:hypothetical protein
MELGYCQVNRPRKIQFITITIEGAEMGVKDTIFVELLAAI